MTTTEQIAKLKELRKATNAAIVRVSRNPMRPRDAVNWADLGCSEAAFVLTDEGIERYQVLIDEADPGACNFQGAVRVELEKAGWDGVDVVTEW